MIKKLIKDCGLRPTRHRLSIGQKVLKKNCHFTAEDICDWASGLKLGMSRATVYNILNEFVAGGLLKSFYTGAAGKTVYDSNLEAHFHFYDVDSKEIVDINPKLLNIDTKKLKDFEIDQMDILFTGRKR